MGTSPSNRLVALDAFRGLTIAGMILVNTPGNWKYVYPPLRHARWEGCTPTDLVFPFFLFIVGTAMWYSFKKFDHSASPAVWKKILKRAALIFAIGLALNAFPFYDQPLSEWRIMGVLQRIAVAFLFGAAICVTVPLRRIPLVTAMILLGYWALLAFTGGPDPYGLENNIARTIDLAIFGENHVYHGFGIPFDPEGLISSIPATGTVLIGFLIGSYIDTSSLKPPAIRNLLGIGVTLTVAGILWGQVFPIIKALWSSSYVLYTAGIATIVLTVFLWLIDIRNYRTWAKPLVVFGINPLFLYSLSVVLIKILDRITVSSGSGSISLRQWLFEEVFAGLAGNMNGSLLFAISYVLIHWAIAYWLYRKDIYIKV